ncbi:MAG TPA: hypothetical protein VMU05_12820 [Dongiaceae bacterium]|nr:hypothetical protein [Dongiaceae bacterium]
MRPGRSWLIIIVIGVLCVPVLAGTFVMFPNAGRSVSPDGRFEIRDAGPRGSAIDFAGTSHSLWLMDSATGRSRKLCDYLGLAAVAWSSDDFIVVTQYVGKRTSRALVFSAAGPEEPVLLDTSTLIQLLPVEVRPILRENDHAFVEATSVEGQNFHFRVWGYGKHDPNGFSWKCQYSLTEGKVACAAASGPQKR